MYHLFDLNVSPQGSGSTIKDIDPPYLQTGRESQIMNYESQI